MLRIINVTNGIEIPSSDSPAMDNPSAHPALGIAASEN
jgi:hypothetical protein